MQYDALFSRSVARERLPTQSWTSLLACLSAGSQFSDEPRNGADFTVYIDFFHLLGILSRRSQ